MREQNGRPASVMVARPGLDLKPILGFIEIRGSMQQLYILDDGGGRGVFNIDQNGSVLVFLKKDKNDSILAKGAGYKHSELSRGGLLEA